MCTNDKNLLFFCSVLITVTLPYQKQQTHETEDTGGNRMV